MADADKDSLEDRLLDLEMAFYENQAGGRLVEADEAETSQLKTY